MPARFPAALIVVGNLNAARAGVCRIQIDNTLFECGGNHNRFENRTGFVGVAYRTVTPLRIERVGGRLGTLGIVGDGGNGFGKRRVGDFSRVIEVEIRLAGHAENRAGVGIHDDAVSVFCAGVHKRLLKPLLEIILNDLVNRQNQAFAGFRVIGGFVIARHRALLCVFRRNDTPGNAGQIVVILHFNPADALVIGIGEADNR